MARQVWIDSVIDAPGLHPVEDLRNLSELVYKIEYVITETDFHMMMVPNQWHMVMLIGQSLVKLTNDPEDYNAKKMVTNCLRAII